MAFPVPLIALALGVAATSFAAIAVTAVLNIGLAIGLSYLVKALTPKPDSPQSLPGGTQGTIQGGGAVPRSFIVGRSMTAGSLAYANTYGAADAISAAAALSQTTQASGNTPNAYYTQVIALSDLPVRGLTGLLVNGALASYDKTAAVAFEGIPIPEYNSSNQIETDGYTIPGSGDLTVSISTATNIGAFTSVASVVDTTSEIDLVRVTAGFEDGTSYSFDHTTKVFTFGSDSAGHDVSISFNYGGSGGTDHLWVRFYDGTQSAADAALVQLFSGASARPYQSTRVGTGVAYAVVTALVSSDVWSGFPTFKFVLDGISLYDRRADSSIGGDGDQRWSDPTTWQWTANNAVIIENILRGISYAGSWVYGAQTVSATQLPSDSWIAAANECDSAIARAAGGTEKQFLANGEISFATQPADAIDELNKACNGKLAESGGRYRLRVGAAGVSVISFTDDDILSTDKQTFDPFPSLGQTINAVTAKYVEPGQSWNVTDAPPLYDTSLEAADGGRQLPVDISYGFVNRGTQVQRLMKSALNDQRAFRHHTLPLPPDFFQIEPLDVVTWTSARNGYSSKQFDTIAGSYGEALCPTLQFKEIDPNAYDWTAGTDEKPVSTGSIVILQTPSQPILDWNASTWTLTSDTGQQVAAIKLTWSPNVNDVNGIAFQLRLASDASAVYSNSFQDSDLFAAGAIIISQNLVFNTAYQVRGKYLTNSNRDTGWSSWIDVTTPDVRIIIDALDGGLNDYLKSVQTKIDDLENQLAQVSDMAGQLAAQTFFSRTNLQAATGDNKASIETLQITQVTDQEAFAAYQVTANVKFGNLSADDLFQVTSSAGDNGALAQVDLQVRASTGDVFAAAGLQLAAMVDADGNAFSRTRLYASQLEVGFPDVTGGDFFSPFGIETVNGALQIGLRPEAIPDGAIGVRTLDSGVLGTIATALSADVTRTYAQWNNSGAGNTVITATINVVAGASLTIDLSTAFTTLSFASPTSTTGFVKIVVGGSVVRTLTGLFAVTSSAGAYSNFSLHEVVADLPGGPTTVTVLFYNDSTDASHSVTAVAPKLFMHQVTGANVVDASVVPSVEYRTSLEGGASGTFTGADIGSADTNRVVVVAIYWQNSNSPPTMTIGGVTATRRSYVSDWFGQGIQAAIFEAPVPTGTTADIIASFGITTQAIAISIWKVVATSHVPVFVGVGYSFDSRQNSASIDSVKGSSGQVLVAAMFGWGSSGKSFSSSWSGSGSPTINERADTDESASPTYHYGAYDATLAGAISGSLSLNCTPTLTLVAVCGIWQ
jgi:hypothetical protein